MSHSEEFADFRRHKAERKADRLGRFDAAAKFIREDAKSIGWSLDSKSNGAWTFRRLDNSERLTWWPASGKTLSGACFMTWPALKQHLAQLAQGA